MNFSVFYRILVRAISYTVHGLIPASCVFADRYNREEVVRSLGKEVNINPPLTLGQLPDTPEELLKLDQVRVNLHRILQRNEEESNAHLLLCPWMHCSSGKSLLNSTESDFLRILFIQPLFSLFSSPFVPLISFPQLSYNSELSYNSDGKFSNLQLPSVWVHENFHDVRTTYCTHTHTYAWMHLQTDKHSLQNPTVSPCVFK